MKAKYLLLAPLLVFGCDMDAPVDEDGAAPVPDARVSADAGPPPDGSSPFDGGALIDGGSPSDAGPPTGLSLEPLPAAVLDAYRDLMLTDGRANAAGDPHLQAHWLEYNYSGPEASMDTSWQPGRAYIAYELTHDGGAKVLRCTRAGTSGSTEPNWASLAAVGDTLDDGTVEWTYVGGTGTLTGTGMSVHLAERMSYYDVLGTTNRVYDYLESIGDENAPRFLLYTRYARGPWRDTYERPNDMRLPGWRRFPGGYYRDLGRWGGTDPDASTAADLEQMRSNVVFARTSYFRPPTYDGHYESMSRATAYAGLVQIYNERVGHERQPDDGWGHYPPNASGTFLEYLVSFAESQLWEWRTQTFAHPEGGRCAPFMFGLTAGFLAAFYEWELESGRDPNAYWPTEHWASIPEGIADVADFIYNDLVVRPGFSNAGERVVIVDAGDGWADARQDDGPNAGDAAPTLILLFTPAYGFVGKYYAEQGNLAEARRFFEMGDHLFSSAAMTMEATWMGKIWFQQFYHSMDYLRWRREAQR